MKLRSGLTGYNNYFFVAGKNSTILKNRISKNCNSVPDL